MVEGGRADKTTFLFRAAGLELASADWLELGGSPLPFSYRKM
jgi:hypothetical protein